MNGMMLPEDEETRRQKALMAALRGTPVNPGVISQSAPTMEELRASAGRDFTSADADLAAQRALGAKMLGGQMPQGKMAGNVFVGPTWSENLAAGVEKGLGAYNLVKAKQRAAELGEEKSQSGKDKLALAEAIKAQENAREEKLTQEEREWQESQTGDSVEMVGPEGDVIQAIDINGQLFMQDRTTPVPEGYRVNPKITRGSGSQYQPFSKKDAYGNEVVTSFNKGTQEWSEPTFIDGTPYTEEEAKRRGQVKAGQEGLESQEKAQGTADVARAEEAAAAQQNARAALSAYQNALDALAEGANTGPIAQYMPSIKPASVKLDNVKQALGLVNLSQNTFGSLSEKEGEWVRDVAIPTGLPEDELQVWIENKMDAIRRAMQMDRYIEDMARAGKEVDQKVLDAMRGDQTFGQ